MSESQESGARLRSLYASEGGVRAIFSTKAADYNASRPDYPAPLFETLRIVCGLHSGAAIADIGSGTGLLTQGLLKMGWSVAAIEPNAAMREASDSLLGATAGYHSLDGCAESIPLPDSSVNLITAAQAFHWFDVEKARPECLRVLRPQGKVALIWNDRQLEDPLQKALEAIFHEFGGAKRAALMVHENRADVPQFFGAATPVRHSWPHAQSLHEEGLAGLVFSRSYIPSRDTPEGQEVRQRIHEIFHQFSTDDVVSVRYQTIAIIGRPEQHPD